MAGDYYDFIHLPEGRLGVLIADVADKGLGPALYMALSRTLIRTFATQHPLLPAQVLTMVNQRILQDARANLFVTVFYAVLDPATGQLTYANAGHPPPYLINASYGIQTLRNTGMPLGIDEESAWGQETVHMQTGDVLLMYTDGVTDAQNSLGEFIDRKMILDVASDCPGKPVELIRQDILGVVHDFVGEAARFDDITLVVLSRD
jgi:serine phosphatase RsbU (regulator of sigma subunit)